MKNLVSDMIACTFLEKVDKHNEKKALLISFRKRIDYTKEEGYRYLDLLIYAPHSYVKVLVRERWVVIPLTDLEESGSKMTPKADKDYVRGASGWTKVCSHDSGWTEGIENTLKKYEQEIVLPWITSFATLGSFYEIVDPPEDVQGNL